MKPDKRQQQIIDILLGKGSASLRELCEHFQCSGGTIRNDLRLLESQGKLIRTFAGATLDSIAGKRHRRTAVLETAAGTGEEAAGKLAAIDAIAQRAVEFVREGDTVLLCAGEIGQAMVARMATFRTLTVITNDLEAAHLLSRNANFSVILIGGQVQFDSNELTGAIGVPSLNSLRVDKAFLSCDGVSGAQGYATDNSSGVQLRAAMLSCAQQIVMLALPDRVGRAAAVSFAPLNSANHLITTVDAPPEVIAAVRASGVRLSLCGDRITEFYAENPPERMWRIGFANLMEDDDFAGSVRQSIEHAAASHGNVQLVLANNAADPDVALANARRFIDAHVDLVIEYQINERTNHALMDMYRMANIPVIAIDIPMPGAIFFGADNYRAGRIGGEAAVNWVRKHWNGRLDRVVCLEQSISGPVPAARIDGQLAALRAGLAIQEKDIVHVDTPHGVLEEARSAATQALLHIPFGQRVLFTCINAPTALGALGAAEALNRVQHTAVIAQNVNAGIALEIKRDNPMLIGAVDYAPQRYGDNVIDMALDVLENRPVKPAVYTAHRLIAPAAATTHRSSRSAHSRGRVVAA